MSDATRKHAAFVDALKELENRLVEFGLRNHSWGVFAAGEALETLSQRPGRKFSRWGQKFSLPLIVCCLRALAIEWPEEADTLRAAALACEAMQRKA